MPDLKAKLTNPDAVAAVPLKWVGPLKIALPEAVEEISVPLATYESPLWPSVERGARVSMQTEGIKVNVEKECMTRSFCVEGSSHESVSKAASELKQEQATYAELVKQSSNFAQLKNLYTETIGTLLYVRLEINSADASGHNMATKAGEVVLTELLNKYSDLSYVSLSGNFCTDKKVSAVNSIIGRGRRSTAEILIPKKICEKFFRTSPEQINDLNIKKNLLGSTLAGSIRSANAHYANILLAFYLATGQDAANIVEGSQGITYTSIQNGDLYFSVTIPNIIVGTVGNGKDLGFVTENLDRLCCLNQSQPGENAKRLSGIIAATVLCGELSLMAALCNPGELTKTHLKLER